MSESKPVTAPGVDTLVALERLERRAARHATLHDYAAMQTVRDDARAIRERLQSQPSGWRPDLLAVALWLNGPLELSQAAMVMAPRLVLIRTDDPIRGSVRLEARLHESERNRKLFLPPPPQEQP